MLKENNSTETKTDKPIGGKAGFIIGCVIIYWLALGIVWGCVSLPGAIDKMSQKSEIKNSKVVLYDGPKSLKDLLCGYIGKHPEMSGQSERSCLFLGNASSGAVLHQSAE